MSTDLMPLPPRSATPAVSSRETRNRDVGLSRSNADEFEKVVDRVAAKADRSTRRGNDKSDRAAIADRTERADRSTEPPADRTGRADRAAAPRSAAADWTTEADSTTPGETAADTDTSATAAAAEDTDAPATEATTTEDPLAVAAALAELMAARTATTAPATTAADITAVPANTIATTEEAGAAQSSAPTAEAISTTDGAVATETAEAAPPNTVASATDADTSIEAVTVPTGNPVPKFAPNGDHSSGMAAGDNSGTGTGAEAVTVPSGNPVPKFAPNGDNSSGPAAGDSRGNGAEGDGSGTADAAAPVASPLLDLVARATTATNQPVIAPAPNTNPAVAAPAPTATPNLGATGANAGRLEAGAALRSAAGQTAGSDETHSTQIVGAARMLLRGPGAPSTMTVTLDPASLGRVKVELITHNGELAVRLGAEQHRGVEAISAGIHQLRTALESEGLRLGEVGVGLSGSQSDANLGAFRSGNGSGGADLGGGRGTQGSASSSGSHDTGADAVITARATRRTASDSQFDVDL